MHELVSELSKIGLYSAIAAPVAILISVTAGNYISYRATKAALTEDDKSSEYVIDRIDTTKNLFTKIFMDQGCNLALKRFGN